MTVKINYCLSMKSKRLYEQCENQLKQILSTLLNIRGTQHIFNNTKCTFYLPKGSIHLKLSIQSKLNENTSKSYQLIIDDKENSTSIPWLMKEIPIEVR